jgi:hypothetical protein
MRFAAPLSHLCSTRYAQSSRVADEEPELSEKLKTKFWMVEQHEGIGFLLVLSQLRCAINKKLAPRLT